MPDEKSQNIDSLNIKINVIGLTDKKIKQIDDFAKVLKKLDTSLTKNLINNLKALSNVSSGFSNLAKFTRTFKNFDQAKMQAFNEFSKGLKKLDTALTPEFMKKLKQLAKIQLGFNYFADMKKFAESIKEFKDQQNKVETQETDINNDQKKDVSKNANQENKDNENLKKRKSLLQSFVALQMKLSAIKWSQPILGTLVGNKISKAKTEVIKRQSDEKAKVDAAKVDDKEQKKQEEQDKKTADELKKQTDKATDQKDEKKTKKQKSSLSSLINSFKRIAIYRMIRTVIKNITDSVREGINNLVLYNQNVNESMSTITTSITNIQNAIGLMAQPLINSFAPIIQTIAQQFVLIGNEVSRLSAQMQGLTSYTKINADYMSNYANSIAKASGFSFDQFNVLASGTGNMYTTESVESSTGLEDTRLNKIAKLLTNIFDLVGNIANLVMNTVDKISIVLTPIIDIINFFVDGINYFIENVPGLDVILAALIITLTTLNVVMNANPVGLIITGIAALIAIIGQLIKLIKENWDTISAFFTNLWQDIVDGWEWFWNAVADFGRAAVNVIIDILNGLITGFENLINWILEGVNALLRGVEGIVKFFGGNLDIANLHVTFGRIPKLADGGVVDAGSMFIAGEAGAELVYNMGNGQTGVSNVEQLQQAVFNAIIQSGIVNAVEEGQNIYLDTEKVSTKVGQSKAIRNQLNRTNPNLRLK